MPEYPTDPQLVTLQPVTVAVLRETVQMNALADFFGRAFHATMTVAQSQGVPLTGPPMGIYFGMPTDTVDVAGGFPTAAAVEPADGVTSTTLPAGRAAQVLHIGPYDTMEQTYGRLMAWLGEQALSGGPVMWESYLNDPVDPETTQTLIVWPLAE